MSEEIFRRGVFAAASGAPKDASHEQQLACIWLMGYDRAEYHRQRGLDPLGKPPRVPGLCARDVRKVCNCADSTRAECVLPVYPAPRKNLSPRHLLSNFLRSSFDFLRSSSTVATPGVPKARVHYTIREGDDAPLICSQCNMETDALATIPIEAKLEGSGGKAAWIGLCRTCVDNLLRGFNAP